MTSLRASLAAVTLALCGCRSASVHLYTLVEFSPVPSAGTSTSESPAEFILSSVSIPRSVDRKELIVRKSTDELIVYDNANWAAPLQDEVTRALAVYLNRAAPAGTSTLLRVRIVEWEATGQAVYLRATWRASRPEAGEAADLRCESRLVEKTSGGAADIVRADQRLLDRLANSIIASAHSSPPHCAQPAIQTLM